MSALIDPVVVIGSAESVMPVPWERLVTVPVPASSVSQVTVPLAAMLRMLLPAAHVPLTRAWICAVSTAIVPAPVIGPPVSPVPVPTLVTVPLPAASQVTAPLAAMLRMLLPTAHVPLTRAWICAVSTAIVPVAVIGPPVSPVPVATLVTVPPELVSRSAWHCHAVPLHFGIWLAAQAVVGSNCVLVRLIVPVAVMGPPARPAPVPTLVTVPPELVSRSAWHCHAVPLHFGIWLAAQAVVGSSCVLARLIVPVAMMGPPVRPAPVPTLVTVPTPPAVAQVQALPFQLATWPLVHACGSW